MDFNASISNITSNNFLEWFLINYFSIDEDLVSDYICDGSNDKGIDGICIDDANEIIYFFQTKFTNKNNTTLGDVDLKNFMASVEQFNDINNLNIIRKSANNSLNSLIDLLALENKIETYVKKAIFITNRLQDPNAIEYSKMEDKLEVYDLEKLEHEYINISDKISNNNLSFNLKDIKYFNDDKFYMLRVSLKDFIKQIHNGIKDSSIFDKNVRYSLGKSNTVAKEIMQTLKYDSQNIILYHNGITIIAEKISKNSGVLQIEKCSIVNGCQSTIAFHNYTLIPDNATIILKIIETNDDKLTNQITRNTNNQNPIQIRDLKSNHKFQEQLKEEFRKYKISYEIKRGEKPEFTDKLSNDNAAQLICAFHLGKPYIATDKTKLFREYYQEIFSNSISAKYIILIKTIFNVINFDNTNLGDITKHKRVNYFLLYAMGELELKNMIIQKIDIADFDVLKKDIHNRAIKLYNNSLKENFVFLINEKNKNGDFDYRNFFRNKKDINSLKDELERDYNKDKARNII